MREVLGRVFLVLGLGPLFVELGEGEVSGGWVRTGAIWGKGGRAGSGDGGRVGPGDGGRVGTLEITGIADKGQRYQKQVKSNVPGSPHNSALSWASSLSLRKSSA